MNPETIEVNGTPYSVIRLLGKGKGGYSWLVEKDGRQYVLKQIHHEPCSYYQFGNKLESELNDYAFLKQAGIRIPELYEVDHSNERLLKEYIDGPLISQLAVRGEVKPEHFDQILEMTRILYPLNTNIDYYPTNFVVQNELLYYIDYEKNTYSDQWNFENWGIQYWKDFKES